MDFDQVASHVDGVPHIRKSAGRRLYDFVVEHELRSVLELGTSHGVSTCYLAAAVDELGEGRVVTLDRRIAESLEPNVFELLARTQLSQHVDVILAERTFTWELRRLLDQPSPPQFDFVFLDAGHTWDVTGFAFFLVDRMLKPGGWMLFDDLNWSIAKSPSLSGGQWARYSEEEREAEQVRMVVDTLVQGDGRYETHYDGNWGWAQKLTDVGSAAGGVRSSSPPIAARLERMARSLRSHLTRS